MCFCLCACVRLSVCVGVLFFILFVCWTIYLAICLFLSVCSFVCLSSFVHVFENYEANIHEKSFSMLSLRYGKRVDAALHGSVSLLSGLG